MSIGGPHEVLPSHGWGKVSPDTMLSTRQFGRGLQLRRPLFERSDDCLPPGPGGVCSDAIDT